jgi:ketosteroid isomerase-like protein
MKLILIIVVPVMLLSSCHLNKNDRTTGLDEEIKSIEKAIRGSIEWAQKKDTSLLYSIIANNKDYLEVDPENRVVKGIKDFKKAERIWLDPRFKAVKCEISDLKINVSKEVTVAWFYCMLNDINEWDGKPACWMNTRWTGVLEKRNNNWVIVQMHFSFASE